MHSFDFKVSIFLFFLKSLFFEDDILTAWRHRSGLASRSAGKISPLMKGGAVGATLLPPADTL